MGRSGWGVLGTGSPGVMLLGTGPATAGSDTRMALGLTYYAMMKLLNAKLPYMSGWTVGLYAISTVFTPTLAASAYTSGPQIPTFDGYAPQALGPWPFAVLTPQNQVVLIAPVVNFTPTGTSHPGPVAGFYVLDSLGKLVGAQQNPQGTIIVGGNTIPFSIAPVFQEQAIA